MLEAEFYSIPWLGPSTDAASPSAITRGRMEGSGMSKGGGSGDCGCNGIGGTVLKVAGALGILYVGARTLRRLL